MYLDKIKVLGRFYIISILNIVLDWHCAVKWLVLELVDRAGLTVGAANHDAKALDFADVVYELHDGRLVDSAQLNLYFSDEYNKGDHSDHLC